MLPKIAYKVNQCSLVPGITSLREMVQMQCILPNRSEAAKIVFVHKGGSNNIMTSHCPTSNIPILAKFKFAVHL